MRAFSNFINGKPVDAADGATTKVVDPVTGEAYAEASLSGPADVDAAMQAAAAAFESWRDSTPSERSLALFRIADAVEARAEELIAVEVENTGKPIALTRSEEIPPMVDQIRFYATAARHLEGKSAGEYMAGHTSWIRREPIGVCAQVAPWNYPMMMAVWKFAPAIAAGNTVVLKPSDTTPASTTLLAEIAAEFLPPGVFNVVCGDRNTGRAMVDPRHPRHGVDHRLGARRHGGRRVGGRRPQAGAPRARRQGARHRVRRRRHRGRRRGHLRRRLLQRRPGLHGGDTGARRAGRLRRLRRRARRGGQEHEDRPARRRGRALRPGQQPDAARAGHRVRRAGTGSRPRARRRRPPGRHRVLLPADRRRRPAAGRRDDPGRGVRPGDHGAALQRRGRSACAGPTG